MNLQLDQNQTQAFAPKPKIDIEALVDTNLPPSPDNVMRLMNLLRDYDAPPRKISQSLVSEPMLVARILRLANSVIYGLDRKVSSIEQAIATIGNKTLLEIVVMGMASSAFDREIRNSVIARKLWEHSLAVAIIARELSATLKMQGTEEAFTCGLLHDIGKLILLSYDFYGFSLLLNENEEESALDAEQRLYGYTHAQIGALVARRWQLQEEVCCAINYHHVSFQSCYPSLAAHVVEVADILANIKGYGLRCETEEKLTNSVSVLRLRLNENHLSDVWTKVEGSINEMLKTAQI